MKMDFVGWNRPLDFYLNVDCKEIGMTISSEQKRLEIIRDILKPKTFPRTDLPVQLAIGTEDADDCAVYDIYDNLSLVVGTDFVRGTNFKLFQEGYLNYFDLGYYLVAANLSDVAAM